MKEDKKYYVLCMGFDGEYKVEPHGFDTIEDAENHDVGSKWYFYPYQFICKGQTVIACGYGLEHLENKMIKTVSNHFNKLYEYCEDNDITMNAEEYYFAL